MYSKTIIRHVFFAQISAPCLVVLNIFFSNHQNRLWCCNANWVDTSACSKLLVSFKYSKQLFCNHINVIMIMIDNKINVCEFCINYKQRKLRFSWLAHERKQYWTEAIKDYPMNIWQWLNSGVISCSTTSSMSHSEATLNTTKTFVSNDKWKRKKTFCDRESKSINLRTVTKQQKSEH